MAKKPTLIFDRGGISGFATLAEQSDLNPTTVVRELVQNSLDAAKEARRGQAIIRFELAKCKPADIPAFDVYKKAFKKAKNSPHSQQDSAQNVITAIERQTKSRELKTLFVMDNGIGLDSHGLNALLADGISHKSRDGAGSYGYGHTTVIPTSDLRYILYGGLRGGKKIAAGHAVLASFKDEGVIKGKDGYFVVKQKPDMLEPFVCPEGKAIPPIIMDKLNAIEEQWGTGSVVVIPGFNHFNEAEDDIDLWESIKKAVACNFFATVSEDKLQIEYREGDRSEVLDGGSIESVLEQNKGEKRSTAFLSGYKANRAYNTMIRGENHTIKTSLGEVAVKLNKSIQEGRSSIDLCRNGMHITDDIPSLSYRSFGEYALFHCLILVDVSNGEFHRLIRKAEPPKHNSIEMKRLDKTEQNKLRGCLNEIKDYLGKNLTKLETEAYDITDVLNLMSYGINTLDELPPRVRRGGQGGGGFRGDDNGGGDGKNGGTGKGTAGSEFKKDGRPVSFGAMLVPTGNRSYASQITLEESKHDNEIRFALDESLDVTCDGADTEDFVYLKNIKIDGGKPEDGVLIKNESGKVLGIALGSGDARRINLSFDFALPDNAGIDDNARVSLQAEMVRRQSRKDESE